MASYAKASGTNACLHGSPVVCGAGFLNPTGEREEAMENNDNMHLLMLLAKIRSAVGDPTGIMMQDDLVLHCEQIYKRSQNASELVLHMAFALSVAQDALKQMDPETLGHARSACKSAIDEYRESVFFKTPKNTCPDCGEEIKVVDPGQLLLSLPPQVRYRCPACDWVGTRKA